MSSNHLVVSAEKVEQTLTRRELGLVLLLMVFAAAFRCILVLEVRSYPILEHPRVDAYYYHHQAVSIAQGDVIGRDVFFRAPGYPYWLGLIYRLFGPDPFWGRIVQHFLGVLAIPLVYLIGRRLFGPSVAATAALLVLLNPVMFFFESQLLFDSFLTFLTLLWLYFSLRTLEHPTIVRWFVVGVLYGLLCVTRPTFLALLIPTFAYIVWRSGKSGTQLREWRVALFLFAGSATAILPVTVRNYIVGNDFVLIASQGGINFYIGNNPWADGFTARLPGPHGASWSISEQPSRLAQELGYEPSPSEQSLYWFTKGVRVIVDHPTDAAQLFLKKGYLVWNAMEIPNNLNFYSMARHSLIMQLLPGGFWIIGPLGLYGMILAWKRRVTRPLVIFVLLYAAVIVAFFVCDRYRLPLIPLLSIYGGYGLMNVLRLLRPKQILKAIYPHGVAVIALILLVNSNFYGLKRESPGNEEFMLGLAEVDRANTLAAIPHFREAAKHAPGIRHLHLHWGLAEWELGNLGAARESFLKELTYHSDSYPSLVNLSSIYLELQKLDSALVYGELAARSMPHIEDAYIVLALAHRAAGNFWKAESVLASGHEFCHESFASGELMLAGLYLARGEWDLADQRYRNIMVNLPAKSKQSRDPEFLWPDAQKKKASSPGFRGMASYGLGQVFVGRGIVDSAAYYFRQAIAFDSSYSPAWADLGTALLQLGDLTGAESAAARSIILDSSNHIHWYNYGIVMGRSRNLKKASDAFENALGIKPDFAEAREKLRLTQQLMQSTTVSAK